MLLFEIFLLEKPHLSIFKLTKISHVTMLELSFVRLLYLDVFSPNLICIAFNLDTVKYISARGCIFLTIPTRFIDCFKWFNTYCYQRFSSKVALTFRLKKKKLIFSFQFTRCYSHYSDNVSNLVLRFKNLVLWCNR